MGKNRRAKTTVAARDRPAAQELADRAVAELAQLARIPEEDPDPVLRISAEQVLVYRNSAGEELCRAWGCRPGQAVPDPLRRIVSAALAGRAVAREEVVVASRTYWITAGPCVNDGCVNLYARDITDYKRTEEALRQAEQKFRAIFDNTSDGIFLHDLESLRLIMGNPACLQMLGYTAEEFPTLTVPDLHPVADLAFIYAQINKFLQGGKPIRHDIRFKRKDGSILFADVSPDLVELDGVRYALVALKDITERKRLEAELRHYSEHLADLVETRTGELQESEKRYRSLYHALADGILVIGMDGLIADVNDSACAQLGYPCAELIGMPLSAISARPPFRLGEIIDRLREAGSLSYETAHRRKDGTIVPIELSVVLVEYRGRPALLGVAREITERKRAEEALRDSEERFRTAFEEGAVAMALTSLDATLLKVNSAFCRMLGFSASELVGKSFIEITHPDDRAANLVGTRQLACGEISSFRMEKRYIRKDGTLLWADMSTASVRDAEGRPQYCVTHVQDITERKRAEESLQFIQFAVDHAAEAAFWMTEDARFCYVNEAACRALGYTREELLQMTVFDIDPVFTESRWRQTRRQLKAEKHKVFETVHRAKDGRTYPVEIHANYLEFGGRAYDCAFARDITERKQAEEALRSGNEQLEQQVAQRTEDLRHTVARLRQLTLELSQAEDRERQRIADILHEDVQQTLAAAKFHLNLLTSEPRSAEEQREIIGRARQMLKDAIEKARSLSHELSPALYQVEFVEVLEWLACQMRQKHGLTVRVHAHGPVNSLPQPLKAFLYKVVQELLFNVVKHAGVSAAEIHVRRWGQHLGLSIVDRGRGFDPERLERAPGFGLLGIHERVQLLGGRMKIKSAPGAGSRFLIVLPYEPAVSPECRDEPAPLEVPAPSRGAKTP